MTSESEYVFFWKPGGAYGCLSQWANSPFICDGKKFSTAEQYMMFKKAEVFNDKESANLILNTPEIHPAEHKKMGKRIRGFDEITWHTKSMDVVVTGNLCKFTQNPELAKVLMGTLGKMIAEASPYDHIWGIGFDEKNAISNSSRWGQNRLGLALMRVRSTIENQIKSQNAKRTETANTGKKRREKQNELPIPNENVLRCPTCLLSKDPENPDFAHVRLGLDEPPEPLLCKCKPDDEIINAVRIKTYNATKYLNPTGRLITSKIKNVDMNPAVIRGMSGVPNVETEARLTPCVSEKMYKAMSSGLFGHPIENEITETGCSWYPGPKMNKIAKLRTRSSGEAVAKIVMYTCQIMPGITIAISYEFEFRGEIFRPEYTTNMTELRIPIAISGVDVVVIARRYNCEDTISFASEVEFKNGVKHAEIRRVMNEILLSVGSENELMPVNRPERFINQTHMDEARHADHDVIDVKDLSPYRGTKMLKADGMKMYVFCYTNGYVVTFANARLTVYEFKIALRSSLLCEITDTPDILVAELMVDGSLVYLDTLVSNGEVVGHTRKYAKKPLTGFEMPPLIMRRCYDEISNVPKKPISSIAYDGIVCVTEFRTLRLKRPTIDLLYRGGFLHMLDNGKMIRVTNGHKKMNENSIYEMSVNRSPNSNQVVLTNPIKRLIKRLPNNSDIIKRAFMSVSTDLSMDTILYDITSMSFKMRARAYELAQSATSASGSRKVIVIFGAGRFQEVSEMRLSDFSYIAIDPEIDITSLNRRAKRATIVPYDVNSSFSKQVIAMSNKPGRVMFFKGRSESFITGSDVIASMSRMRIPAVFSFSISYHISVINTLADSGVGVYGCGFVHNNLPKCGIRSGPVTMKVVENVNGLPMVESKFGKSTWVEPVLLKSAVSGLHPVQDEFEEVWSNVDSSTSAIMSRAVILF